MTNLLNKIVLLTGANGGFGRALIPQLLQEGSKLILTDLEIDKSDFTHPNILDCIETDISTIDGRQKLFEQCHNLVSSIDLLINNAGIAIMGKFINIPDEKWQKVIDVNLLAPMHLTKMFLSEMIEKKSGHIVNVTSVAGIAGMGDLTPYCVSKAGLSIFGECLCEDLFVSDIKVTNVYPFFAKTPILDCEQVGYTKLKTIPDFLIYDPKDVMKALVQGIKKNRLYVYPGSLAKLLYYSKRFSPPLFMSAVKLLRRIEVTARDGRKY